MGLIQNKINDAQISGGNINIEKWESALKEARNLDEDLVRLREFGFHLIDTMKALEEKQNMCGRAPEMCQDLFQKVLAAETELSEALTVFKEKLKERYGV